MAQRPEFVPWLEFNFGLGYFPALAVINGVTTMVFTREVAGKATGIVRVENGIEVGFIPNPTLGFPVIDSEGNLAYIDQHANGWLNGQSLGPLFDSQHPILVGFGRVVYQRLDGVYQRRIEGGPEQRIGNTSPMGLSYLTESEHVTWDDNRLSVAGMLNPSRAGSTAIFGQGPKPGMGIKAQWNSVGASTGTLFPGQLWNDIAACVEANGDVACASWSPQPIGQVRLLTGISERSIADLPPVVIPPPIVVPPVVVPPPPPEVHMTLHADVVALFRRYLAVFPVPNGAPGSEEHFVAMRVWMRKFCEQVRFSFPDGMPGVGGEFGWKRASTGRPESKESLALQTSGGLGCWDLFKDVGLGNPQADFTPDFHDIWNPPEGPQVFIPVTATDHLSNPGTNTPPTPGRATITGPWMAFGGFNLLERTQAERDAWLREFPRGAIHRVMLARTKDAGRDTSWTPEKGLVVLPLVLRELKAVGQRMHLTINCDTKLYNRSRNEVREVTRQVSVAVLPFDDTSVLASVQLFNEPLHSTQQDFCADPVFNAELEALFPLRIPVTWGPTTHGGLVGGSFGTIHGDRSLTPEENAQYAYDLKDRYLREFVDDEPLGIAEENIPGRRTNDPDYARRLAQAAKDRGLLGATLHWEAGLTADASLLGPVHREAMKRFVAVFGAIPVPVPPPQGHPILDAPLSPADPVGYRFFIANVNAIESEAIAWYRRAFNREPASTDVAHGIWRGLNEGERWGTLRRAWDDTWPGGGPR